MAESEVSYLKEALHNQYITMTKLYMELEEERKASASAADEALSMILRLQEEKAAEKMQASQYKRIAEEKIQYAEESLAFLQQILHQKDLEIEFLKYQVMAYEHRLFSAGCDNPDFGVTKTHNNPSLNRSSVFLGKRHYSRIARRNISLPAIQFEKLCSEMGIVDEDQTLLLSENHEESHLSKQCLLEECNSDQEQAEEVKLKAKEIVQSIDIKERARSVSSLENNKFQETAINSTLGFIDSGFCSCCKTVDSVASSGSALESKFYAIGISPLGTESNLASAQDISEVPQNVHGCSGSESDQILLEAITEGKHMTKILKQWSQEAADLSLEDDELLKKTSKNSNIGISPSQTEIEKLKERIQQLEDDRKIMKQEDFEREKEQLKLLHEIHEQLDTIQYHMQNLKFKKSQQQEHRLFLSLMEAVLHFSI